MRRALLLMLICLTGCAAATTTLPRPSEGYRALRFTETVRLPGGVGTWEFPVGTVLAADRRRDRDGATLYCGSMLVRDALGAKSIPMCVLWADGKLGVGAEYSDRGWVRDVPAGSVEEVQIR